MSPPTPDPSLTTTLDTWPFAGSTIPRLIETVAARYPDRDAVAQRGTTMSYRELFESVCSLSDVLLELGVERGDKVGLWLPNYTEWIVASLAVAAVGGVNVPVNTRFRAGEARYVLGASDVSVLITTDRFMTNDFVAMLESIVPECRGAGASPLSSAALPTLRHVLGVRTDDSRVLPLQHMMNGRPTTPSVALRERIDAADPDDVVNMFWTSGTTGTPKGALCTHRVLENIWHYSERLAYTEEDRCLAPTPLFYTTANYWVMLVALMRGACVVPLLEFTPDEVLGALESEKITVTVGIPNMFINFLKHPEIDNYDTSALRRIWIGGATTPVELVRDLTAKFGIEALHQVYGMTETGGITTITPVDADAETIAASVGRPLENFELRLVNPSTGADVSEDEGELWVRSPYNLKGYYGMTDAELAHHFTEDGWFKTGDILRRDEDQNYFFRGRNKDMIKVKGENVAAREVENVLFSHPAVIQVAVIGLPDAVRNEAVVAVVETRQPCSSDELLSYCKTRMAPFKVPSRFYFRDDWPLTATGKIQKFKLVQELAKSS
jgi:fatty-acyl-CoA synthase